VSFDIPASSKKTRKIISGVEREREREKTNTKECSLGVPPWTRCSSAHSTMARCCEKRGGTPILRIRSTKEEARHEILHSPLEVPQRLKTSAATQERGHGRALENRRLLNPRTPKSQPAIGRTRLVSRTTSAGMLHVSRYPTGKQHLSTPAPLPSSPRTS